MINLRVSDISPFSTSSDHQILVLVLPFLQEPASVVDIRNEGIDSTLNGHDGRLDGPGILAE